MNYVSTCNLLDLLGFRGINGHLPANFIQKIELTLVNEIICDHNNVPVSDFMDMYDNDGNLITNYKKYKLSANGGELVMNVINFIKNGDKMIPVLEYIKNYNQILRAIGYKQYNKFITDMEKEIQTCEDFLNYAQTHINDNNINPKKCHYHMNRMNKGKMMTSVFLPGHFRSMISNHDERQHVTAIVRKYFPSYTFPDTMNAVSNNEYNKITFMQIIGETYDSIYKHIFMLKSMYDMVLEEPAYMSIDFFFANYMKQRSNFVIDKNNDQYNNFKFPRMELFSEIYFIKIINPVGFVNDNNKNYGSRYLTLAKSINGNKWNIFLYSDTNQELTDIDKVLLEKLDKIKKNLNNNIKNEI